jgi:hypothetical protein
MPDRRTFATKYVEVLTAFGPAGLGLLNWKWGQKGWLKPASIEAARSGGRKSKNALRQEWWVCLLTVASIV